MIQTTSRLPLQAAITSWCLALIALVATPQQAAAQDNEANPYYIGASQAFTHDSNLFRVADGTPATSDTYSSTGVLAGVNQPFGRQRFFADVNVQENRFRDTDRLNNTSYGVATGLDLSTIERLSGTLRYSRNESLADYSTIGAPQLTSKNIENTEQYGATVRYGITARTALVGGLQHREVAFSSAAFADREYKQNAANFGVSYGASGLLTLGTGVRHTSTRYIDDKTSRDDFDVTATWVPSGLSTVSARISATREQRSVVSQRDFSGTTGSLRPCAMKIGTSWFAGLRSAARAVASGR